MDNVCTKIEYFSASLDFGGKITKEGYYGWTEHNGWEFIASSEEFEAAALRAGAEEFGWTLRD